MKTKLVVIIFAIIVVFLGVFFYFSSNQEETEVTSSTQAKIINPKYTDESQSENQADEETIDSDGFTSLIDLSPTETLISGLTFDLDNDTYDDQVVVVRKASSRFLFVVVGVYNQDTKRYERIADINTGISKTGTFGCSALDVIGNHSQALIFQGYNDKDDYILNIFLCKNNEGKTELVNIGSFSSDGTVFIQQTERAESYELGISNGESFSVWVYSSDKETNPDSAVANQIQTEYKWNPSKQEYEIRRSTTVSAGSLAANELSKIQNGTVETFANFMEGLWYKTSNSDNLTRYLYFDYPSKEIIFFCDDTEEIYIWEDSRLRYNGIFITTSNSIITTLVRRFSITLSSIDEINVYVNDEVSMNISASSLWDGTYKKTTPSYMSSDEIGESSIQSFISNITSKSWFSDDNAINIDFEGNKYVAKMDNIQEFGVYSIFRVANDFVIQFRSLSEYAIFGKEYRMNFGTKIIEETIKNKTVEKTVVDEDVLILTPSKITPTEVFITEGKVIDFKALEQ